MSPCPLFLGQQIFAGIDAEHQFLVLTILIISQRQVEAIKLEVYFDAD